MRGKKSDPEFICNFISECVSSNILTTEGILQEASLQLNLIDNQIKEVEKLKIRRSKLLDVISSMGETIKNNDLELQKMAFLQIQNQKISEFICDKIKQSSSSEIIFEDLDNQGFEKTDLIFCIKQMMDNDIIQKNENIFKRGKSFDNYLIVLKEF